MTYDYIEVASGALALALMAQLVRKREIVNAEHIDGTWVFKVETTHADFTRTLLAEVA